MATKRTTRDTVKTTATGSSASMDMNNMTMGMDTDIEFYMIGDSDIARWPKDLLPSLPGAVPLGDVLVHGRSGATMGNVAQMATDIFNNDYDGRELLRRPRLRIVVGCAGENDGGQGIQTDATFGAFQRFLQSVLGMQGGPSVIHDNASNGDGNGIIENSSTASTLLLFLGPKLEPWMAGDDASFKQYAKLSRGLKRACDKFNHQLHGDARPATPLTQEQRQLTGPRTNARIHYMDCLTMFCLPSTIDLPGAVMGCRAVPDIMFFDHDYLHLNHKGYALWRHNLEPLLAYAAQHGSWPPET